MLPSGVLGESVEPLRVGVSGGFLEGAMLSGNVKVEGVNREHWFLSDELEGGGL